MALELSKPRYWFYWLIFALLYLLSLLPYRVLMALGRYIGALVCIFAKRRKHVARVNIDLCFPKQSEQWRAAVLKGSFQSAGQAAMEMIVAWFYSERRFNKIPFDFYGFHELATRLNNGETLLVCGNHMTCLEMVGRYFASRFELYLVYQHNRNPFIEWAMTRARGRYATGNVLRKDVKAMIKTLRNKKMLWIAPDQDLGKDVSVFAPFFNVPTATLKLMPKMAKVGGAGIIFAHFNRKCHALGYDVFVKHPSVDYPSGDDLQDAITYNQLLEAQVSRYPEQYLWHHRRFKTRPEGEGGLY